MPASLRQSGVALVIVLWVTALLTIMAAAFSLSLQREAKLLAALRSQSQANALAEGGLHYAFYLLSSPMAQAAQNGREEIYNWSYGDGEIRIRVNDETGKVDLNYVGRETLADIFKGVGMASQAADGLADAILDWRDPDDDVHLNGAELKDYRMANLPYAPRNGPFQSVEELQWVFGVDAALFEQLQPMFTVHTHSPTFNQAKAPPALLLALQNAGALAQDAVDNLTPGAAQTPDAFPDAGDDRPGTSARRSGSGIYHIDVTATLPDGQSARLAVVARRGGGAQPFTVLKWTYPNLPEPDQAQWLQTY